MKTKYLAKIATTFALLFMLTSQVYVKASSLENQHALTSFFACTGSGSIDIQPILNLNACTGSGTIDLNFNPNPGDIILWNDGNTGTERIGLGSGQYSVNIIIDDCDSTFVFNLDFPENLELVVSSAVDKNCVQGTISNPSLGSLTVGTIGGVGPFRYILNNLLEQDSPTFDNLDEGLYTIEVVDANGCESQVTHEIRCVGCHITGNPVQQGDRFFVDVFFGDTTETAVLEIYNSIGRKVLGGINIPVNNGSVDSFPVVADLEPGTYIVLIKGDSISFSRQLIVVN